MPGRSSFASVAAALAVAVLTILCGLGSASFAQANPLPNTSAVLFGIRHTTPTTATVSCTTNNILEQLRGGSSAATAAVVDDEESEDDEMEDDDEEEVGASDASMTRSIERAAQKAKNKAAKASKEAVSAKLLFTAPTQHSKGKTQSLLKKLMVPYILRALLNPLTLIRMTRGYWASLFQLEYLKANVVRASDWQ
jgi:hypothetical protein